MLPLVGRGIASLAGRMIARNPRLGKNLLSLFKKKPTEGITVFRGEPWKSKETIKDVANWMYGPTAKYGRNRASTLRHAAAGRWFTDQPKYARGFSGSGVYSLLPSNWKNIMQWGGGYRKGIVKKIILSEKEAKLARKMVSKIHGHKMPESMYMVPKKALKRAEKDELQTFIANLYKMIGKYKNGGLAQILNV